MKLKIKGDKDSYEIDLEYCASCAGGDDNIKYLKDETEFTNKKTPACRGCGWDGPSIAGILEACLNC